MTYNLRVPTRAWSNALEENNPRNFTTRLAILGIDVATYPAIARFDGDDIILPFNTERDAMFFLLKWS